MMQHGSTNIVSSMSLLICLSVAPFCVFNVVSAERRSSKHVSGNTVSLLLKGPNHNVQAGFSTTCVGPITMPTTIKSIVGFRANIMERSDNQFIVGLNVYLLQDSYSLKNARMNYGNTGTTDDLIFKHADFEKAFKKGACFTREDTGARYEHPSIYDWDGRLTERPLSRNQLDMQNFSSSDVGINIQSNDVLYLEVHYSNFATDMDSLVDNVTSVEITMTSSTPKLPVKPVSLTDGKPPLEIQPGTRTHYRRTYKMAASSQIFAYHSHFHELGVRAWLDVQRKNGPEISMFLRDVSMIDGRDENFRTVNPPLELSVGDILSINCAYDAGEQTDVVKRPEDMCIFYMLASENFATSA